jgi:RNA polymerase sigma-70 factor (ECF subfamily)
MEAADDVSGTGTVDVGDLNGQTRGIMNGDGGRDEAALSALASGDRVGALSHCVHEHGLALGRYAMAVLGSRSEADDVVRAVLLAWCVGEVEVAGGSSLRAALMSRVRRDCARRLEHRRGGPFRVVAAGERVPDAPGETRERAERARASIQRLRPTEREALLARFVAQLSYPEIAAAWEVEEGEVRRRVSRALATLAPGGAGT